MRRHTDWLTDWLTVSRNVTWGPQTSVVEALCYKHEGCRFKIRWDQWISSIYLIIPATLNPGVYTASVQDAGKKNLRSKARPLFETDNLTAICEPIVYTMRDPKHLTKLQASTACYGRIFTFLCLLLLYMCVFSSHFSYLRSVIILTYYQCLWIGMAQERD
jgi:hypothetical protein